MVKDAIDLDSIKRHFLDNSSKYKQLEEETRYIIESKLKETNIKTYSVDSRVKNIDSFMEKVQRKKSMKPFEEIQDIVGLRIVCLFLSDIHRIGELLNDSFNIITEDNKIDHSESFSFGYLSNHFVAILKEHYSGPRYDQIKGLSFEIQVRTLTMDAWANISHYLDYKSELDIPHELKRDFYALSGLFYVADTHFEMFFKQRERNTQILEKSDLKPDQEINLDSFQLFLNRSFPNRDGPRDISEVSDLISELKQAGYKTIGDVKHVLDITEEAFNLYEEERPPGPPDIPSESDPKFNSLGVVRISLRIYDDNYRHMFYKGHKEVDKYKILIKK